MEPQSSGEYVSTIEETVRSQSILTFKVTGGIHLVNPVLFGGDSTSIKVKI